MPRKKRAYRRCAVSTERMQRIGAALERERADFNAAIARGAEPVLQTAFGPYVVVAVNADHWYTTYPYGVRRLLYRVIVTVRQQCADRG
jgi:hypothetical protein